MNYYWRKQSMHFNGWRGCKVGGRGQSHSWKVTVHGAWCKCCRRGLHYEDMSAVALRDIATELVASDGAAAVAALESAAKARLLLLPGMG